MLIFVLSSQNGSESGRLSGAIVKILLVMFGESGAALSSILHSTIRQIAHGTAFFVLALLVVNILSKGKSSIYRSYLNATAFSVGYALSDEIHQLFVPGRACELKDLLTDCVGIVLAIGSWELARRIRMKGRGEDEVI